MDDYKQLARFVATELAEYVQAYRVIPYFQGNNDQLVEDLELAIWKYNNRDNV